MGLNPQLRKRKLARKGVEKRVEWVVPRGGRDYCDKGDERERNHMKIKVHAKERCIKNFGAGNS